MVKRIATTRKKVSSPPVKKWLKWTSYAMQAGTAQLPNIERIQAPTDIGDWYLKTRSMLRNMLGRPRSMISKTGEMKAPAVAIQSATRVEVQVGRKESRRRRGAAPFPQCRRRKSRAEFPRSRPAA